MRHVVLGIVVFLMLVGAVSVLHTRAPDSAGKPDNGAQDAGNGAKRIETRIDEGASALGVKVIPHEVVEDSRCPLEAECIQAGTVRLRATLESGLGQASQIFELGKPITTEGETVTLVEVSPARSSERDIEENDYAFYFEIKRR